MNWNKITDLSELKKVQEDSYERPVLIYKHSSRCNISSVVKNSLESSWDDQEMEQVGVYFIDIISNRDISDAIASQFGIKHESPQLLLIRNGACVYHTSHMNITYKKIKSKLSELPV